MANKIVKTVDLQHNFDSNAPFDLTPFDGDFDNVDPEIDPPATALVPKARPNPGIDKSKSLSEMTNEELSYLIERLREEARAEELIQTLRRYAGERDSYAPIVTDTVTPVNQLYHYGILGMKWGVRRYQNPDGSRTAAGKRREREQAENPQSKDHRDSRKAKDKGIQQLSNKELKQLNERLQLEETYKRLTPAKIAEAESWISKALSKGRDEALSEFGKGLMLGGAKLLVKEASPELAEVAFNMKQKKEKGKKGD